MYRGDMTVNIGLHSFAILFAISLLCPVPSAQACSCAGLETPTDAAAKARVVFEGLVTRNEAQPTGQALVTFQVVRAFRGQVGETVQLRVESPADSPCAPHFTAEEGYLVYANGESGALTVGPCTRTRPISQADKDLQELGPGAIPIDATQPVPEAMAHTSVATRSAPPSQAGCASCQVGVTQGSLAAGWPFALLGLVLGTSRYRTRKTDRARNATTRNQNPN